MRNLKWSALATILAFACTAGAAQVSVVPVVSGLVTPANSATLVVAPPPSSNSVPGSYRVDLFLSGTYESGTRFGSVSFNILLNGLTRYGGSGSAEINARQNYRALNPHVFDGDGFDYGSLWESNGDIGPSNTDLQAIAIEANRVLNDPNDPRFGVGTSPVKIGEVWVTWTADSFSLPAHLIVVMNGFKVLNANNAYVDPPSGSTISGGTALWSPEPGTVLTTAAGIPLAVTRRPRRRPTAGHNP